MSFYSNRDGEPYDSPGPFAPMPWRALDGCAGFHHSADSSAMGSCRRVGAAECDTGLPSGSALNKASAVPNNRTLSASQDERRAEQRQTPAPPTRSAPLTNGELPPLQPGAPCRKTADRRASNHEHPTETQQIPRPPNHKRPAENRIRPKQACYFLYFVKKFS